jgi:hypothetical protein
LTVKSSHKNAPMGLTWLEFDLKLNTQVIEYFLLFLTVICTH